MSRTQVAIQPVTSADLKALGEFFAGLSVQTRSLRFFAPISPGPALLRQMCRAGGTDAVVAVRDGVIVGHAMAVDRAGEAAADLGVVVADRWQGHGIGAALVRALLAGAQARGITSLVMDVLPGNERVFAMITSHWAVTRTERTPDGLTIRAALPGRPPEHVPVSRRPRQLVGAMAARS